MPNTPVKFFEYMLTCEDSSKIYPCVTQMNTIHGEQHYTCEACEIEYHQQNNAKPVKKNLN